MNVHHRFYINIIDTVNMGGDIVIDHTHEGEQQKAEMEPEVISAHRIILASHCNWFRRALLSGMREAIDK